MKGEIVLDSSDLADEIAERVLKAVLPLLDEGRRRDNGDLVDVQRLAVWLGVTKQWVYERVHGNDIPHFKVGKYPRFRRHDIEMWLERRRRGPKSLEGR